MTGSLRLYLRYAGISIRSQMQYRLSFILQTVGHFVTTGLEFLMLWALFDRFKQLKGWTMPEAALFYATVNIAWSITDAFARGFDIFGSMVKSGEFDRVLLRPRSTAFQILSREVQLKRIGRLAQGLIILTWAMSALDVRWTVGRVAVLMASILGGACMFMGIVILQATLAFWTTEGLEIMNALTYGGIETAQYPMDIYRTWFRRFFTAVVPLACVGYYPMLAVLGRDESPWMWVAPAAGVVFLGVSLRFWQFGVRRYCSAGS